MFQLWHLTIHVVCHCKQSRLSSNILKNQLRLVMQNLAKKCTMLLQWLVWPSRMPSSVFVTQSPTKLVVLGTFLTAVQMRFCYHTSSVTMQKTLKNMLCSLNMTSSVRMKTNDKGHAQFIVATHSPILLACPCADIYSFDEIPVKRVSYEETEHYRLYKGF